MLNFRLLRQRLLKSRNGELEGITTEAYDRHRENECMGRPTNLVKHFTLLSSSSAAAASPPLSLLVISLLFLTPKDILMQCL